MKGSHEVSRLALVCAVVLVIGIGGLAGLPSGLAQAPQPEVALGTAFTYQGRLTDNGSPADGTYDFQFKLYDAFTGGSLLGTAAPGDVPVSGGLFTLKLDFGSDLFSGDARWLQIGVRPGDSGGAYTLLDPRQELTPSPYALALPGLWTQQNATSPNLIGGYNGNWTTAGVTGATIGGGGDGSWPNRVTDNYGTVGGGQGNQAGDGDADPTGRSHASVGGGYFNTASGGFATVGGGGSNTAGGDLSTVAGGHQNTASGGKSTVGGGQSNQASGGADTVGGGESNQASGGTATVGGGIWNISSGKGATIGGGIWNVANGGDSSTVGGGYDNAAGGDFSTIGGGAGCVAGGGAATVAGGHLNTASSNGSTVGGGGGNTASGETSTVGGGSSNTASADFATVGGGTGNTASGDKATVGGGNENTASGWNATVPGGWDNTAQGSQSLAAGRRAKANNTGCFVWGDSTDADVTCENDNRWVARASGGVYFYTNSGLSSGVYVPAGGNAWSSVSDRNLKENVASVDGQEVLARLAQVPITSWNYKSQDAAIRHMGPMAQDFYGAFGLGEDDTHISTVDADGVALAAIQGLYEQVQEKDARIAALESETSAQQAQIDDLAARLAALEASGGAAKSAQDRSGAAVPWLLAGGLVVAGGTLAGWRRRPGGGR